MQNPIIQQMTKQSPIVGNLQKVKEIMATIKNANNPQAMFNQMMGNNPQMKQVMDYVNQNGGNAEKAFYSYAQQQGINPNEIINMLK